MNEDMQCPQLGPDGFELTGNCDYDQLAACLKALYTFEQYQWLSGDEKARLVQGETEPEVFE
jgi:hypothetical protein